MAYDLNTLSTSTRTYITQATNQFIEHMNTCTNCLTVPDFNTKCNVNQNKTLYSLILIRCKIVLTFYWYYVDLLCFCYIFNGILPQRIRLRSFYPSALFKENRFQQRANLETLSNIFIHFTSVRPNSPFRVSIFSFIF